MSSSLEAIQKYLAQQQSQNKLQISPDSTSNEPLSHLARSVIVSAQNGGDELGGSLTLKSGNSSEAFAGSLILEAGVGQQGNGMFFLNPNVTANVTEGGERASLEFKYTSDPLVQGQSIFFESGPNSAQSGSITILARGSEDYLGQDQEVSDFHTAYGVSQYRGGDITIQAGRANNLAGVDGWGGSLYLFAGANGAGATSDKGKIALYTGDSVSVAGGIEILAGSSSLDTGRADVLIQAGSYVDVTPNGGETSAGRTIIEGGDLVYSAPIVDRSLTGGAVEISGGRVIATSNDPLSFWKGGAVSISGGAGSTPQGEQGDLSLEGHLVSITSAGTSEIASPIVSLNTPIVSHPINVSYQATGDMGISAPLGAYSISAGSVSSSSTNDTTFSSSALLSLTSNGALNLTSSQGDVIATSSVGNVSLQAEDNIYLNTNAADVSITAKTNIKLTSLGIPIDPANTTLNDRLLTLSNEGVLSALGLRVIGAGYTEYTYGSATNNITEFFLTDVDGFTGGDQTSTQYTGSTITASTKAFFSFHCPEILSFQNQFVVDQFVSVPAQSLNYLRLQGDVDIGNAGVIGIFYVFFDFTA
jgi:hypothetical protein